MKLIIQIPCYNEEETLAIAIGALPKTVPGFDSVEYLVINDGSQDKTVEVAKKCGVHHIVNFKNNKGLAKAFMAGLAGCIEAGADVIVNTDADNQYEAQDIHKLTTPVLENRADIVVGARPISETQHFSPLKKFLQKLGSWVVRVVSKTDIPDAPSGFRAFSKQAAMSLNVFNDYTYTIETIIQAGQQGMAITSVPIRTNPELRPSRLFRSIPQYVKKSAFVIIRIFVIYKPFQVFATIASLLGSFGFLLLARFLYYFLIGEGSGHVQSVVFGAALLMMAVQIVSLAFIADLLSVNRKLSEEIKLLLKNKES